MEVAVPASPVDFNFDSACSSPYITAPSSPQRFGNFFFSAPTTPTRAAAFYYELGSTQSSEIPFLWEEKPGIPKSGGSSVADEDFEFDFSGQLERTSLSAEELFDCGKIRPLKPPPCHRVTDSVLSNASSPRSPTASKMPQRKRIQEAQSPRHYRGDFDLDPFEEAFKATRKRDEINFQKKSTDGERNRGRERATSSTRSPAARIKRSGSRSLSPLRVSDIMLDPDQETPSKSTPSNNRKDSVSSSSSFLSFSFSRGNRKWRIRDLLFRSASEGRAAEKKTAEEMKNSSFRLVESGNSRRRGPISAHELHYKTNRAVSEELRKKTTLPYKHGLLGCLRFNSSISRGIGSLTRG